MRLESFVSQHPDHQQALELLGEVLYAMGDLPRAGRYWFMTARDDADATRALGALRTRYPRPEQLLAALRVREEPDGYPPIAVDRFHSLRAQAAARGFRWAPTPDRKAVVLEQPRSHWWTPIVLGAIVLLVVAVIVAGVISLVELTIDFVT